MKKVPTCWELFGVECDIGWKDIIEPLIKECQEKGITITQIKEKYGTLRFYVAGCTDEMWDKIEAAELKSAVTCEICGAEGKLRSNGGWLKTLCNKHTKELKYGNYD